MNEKKEALLQTLLSQLPDEEKGIYSEIAYFLAELGYAPEKQRTKDFMLSFRHKQSGKVIAKAGVRKGKGIFSAKFFGCTDVPPRYAAALESEIHSRNGQYCGPLRSQTQKNQCNTCASCTGGKIGYVYSYPDGHEVLRCGAYPIPIPGITQEDASGLKSLLTEQHGYFLSLQ